MVSKPRVWVAPALVSEVRDVEEGKGIVDVSVHGGAGVVPIGRDREGPVVHQAGDHVRCESNDHGLCWEESRKGGISLEPYSCVVNRWGGIMFATF